MNDYEIVKIPTSLGIVEKLHASSIEEVREWVLNNLDTSTRWIIRKDGKNIAEAIEVYLWSSHTGRQKMNYIPVNSSTWFSTEEDSLNARKIHKEAAEKRLDIIEERLLSLMKELDFDIEHIIHGDTHGVEYYQCIDVVEGGYTFSRMMATR